MKRRIRVRGERREQTDLDKLAFALLRLAEQLTPEECERLRAIQRKAGSSRRASAGAGP